VLLCNLQIPLSTMIQRSVTQQRGVWSGSGRCDEQGGARGAQATDGRKSLLVDFWSRVGLVLLGTLVVTGCTSAIATSVPQAGPDTACITPALG
jgi:hypothetical protein